MHPERAGVEASEGRGVAAASIAMRADAGSELHVCS
jgi:hypothetical protein